MLGPWDELLDERGDARPAAAEVMELIERIGVEELQGRQAARRLFVTATRCCWRPRP